MTDTNGKQHVLDAIERLLAGETVDLEGMADEERRQLLQLARDLKDARPQPSAEFSESLESRIMQEIAAKTEDAKQASEQEKVRKPKAGGWLPPWFTLRRVAAISTALVIGLGIAGLTGAIIGERGTEITGTGDSGRLAYVTDEPDAGAETGAAESMRSGEDAGAIAAGPEGMTGGQTAAGPAGADGTIPQVRQVIQSADYEIEVASGEFQDKYSEIAELAARYGGYVVSADTSASEEDGAINSGSVTIRIADTGDNFTQAMSELDELGKIVSRDVSGEDVTDQYVDLQSRLRNAQAHEASLLGLMERAATVEEMLMVESQLNVVRAEIEQLQGQINYIENRSDYAAITVDLYEEGATAGDKDTDDGFDWGFTDALEHSGWLAVQTVNFVIMALGVIVPVALILTLVTAIIYRVILHRRSNP